MIGLREKGSDTLPKRLPGKMVLKYVAEMVAMQKIPDLNSGLRCFRASVIKRYLHLLPDGFSASSTSTLLMIMRGYRLAYKGIKTKSRVGTSSVRMLRDGFGTLQLIIRILILFKAMSFFSVIATIQIVIGVSYGIIINFMNMQGMPVLAAILIISGLLTFFIGLLCDQIVCLRKERFEEF